MRGTRGRDLWLLISLVTLFLFVLFRNDGMVRAILWTALGMAAVAVILTVTIVRRLWARSAWLLICIAIFLYVLGHMIWSYNVFEQPDSPVWAWSAIGVYIASYALLIIAVLVIVHMRRTSADASSYLDAAVVLVASGMLAMEYLVYPLWENQDIPSIFQGTGVASPIVDVLLLAATVRLWYATDRAANRAVRILAISLVLLVVVDVVNILTQVPNGVRGDSLQGVIDAGYLLVYVIAAAAALDPTAVRPPAADVESGLAARSRVLVMLGICILVPPILLLFTGNDDWFPNSKLFVVMTLTLTLLLMLRVNLLVRGYREAIRREHLLREINAELMRATRRTDITNGLNSWAAGIVEQDIVECILGTVDELSDRGIGAFGTRIRDENGDLRYRTIVSVPGSRPVQRLVVDTHDLMSTPAQASLAVLGQSVGMALERLNLAERIIKQATNERLELLLHNATDVIAQLDDEGKVVYITEAIRDLTDEAPSEVLGQSWPSLFEDSAHAKGLLDRAREDEEASGDLVVGRQGTKNQQAGPVADVGAKRVDVNVVWIADERQFVVTHHDVTDRVRLEQELKHQAFHDALTGLNNRSVFRDQLVRASARARRTDSRFAVMMLDLDDFKNVNDSLGHPAGDELLRVVARRIVECVREGDTPVRLGGDEFAAILESASTEESAVAVAQRVLTSLSEPVMIRGNSIVTGASIGLAMSDGTAATADVERDADIALYEAKFDGKSRVRVFQSDMHETAKRKLALTNDLRVALDNSEILVRYQPIIDLSSGGIAGAEALVRWNHPSLGELLPDMFIPLAEESAQINAIGDFVLNQALRDLAAIHSALPRHSGMRVSVNLSVKELQSRDVASSLAAGLSETGVAPGNVVCEVTESVLLPDESDAVGRLRELSALGVSVYLDDFGTGWASLHYLRSLPINGVKLASEFVAGLPQDQDIGLVRAVREMSNSLQLEEVVAEGIENDDQRLALLGLGYRLSQGYLMAHPMTFDELIRWMEHRKPAPWNVLPPARQREDDLVVSGDFSDAPPDPSAG